MSAAFGILIMCYVQVSPGQYDWVKGREVAGDELILFKADGRKAEYVNSNNCNLTYNIIRLQYYLNNSINISMILLENNNED